MFDGAAAATVEQQQQDHPDASAPLPDHQDTQQTDTPSVAAEQHVQPGTAEVSESSLSSDTLFLDPGVSTSGSELLFIDPKVYDYQKLVELARPGVEVVVLDPLRDGLQQITETLAGRSDVSAVHIVSHGEAGRLYLGSSDLTLNTIVSRAGELASWSSSLTPDADLLLYGCDIAAGDSGRAFVDTLAAATGADVAASTDTTGNWAYNGDWTLEYAVGQIGASIGLTPEVQDAWLGVLATTSFQQGVSAYAGTQDTYIHGGSTGTNYGGLTDVNVDLSDGGAAVQGMIRFDNLFGAGANQIPVGAFIDSASLIVRTTGSTAGTISLHRMLVNWTEDTATWDTLVGGLNSGTDYAAPVDSQLTNLPSGNFHTFTGLASTLQLWSDGTANDGWAILNDNSDGWDFASSENGTQAWHPQLQVTWHTNAAPVLDPSKTPVLDPIVENAGAPSGAVGTLVSSLLDFASPAGQVDNVTDADVGAVLGIAVTGADTANGTWWYSTNGGTNWNALGAVSDANARLLAADANTRLYFQPNPAYNGTIANAITFRAWDQTAGTNGTTANVTTPTSAYNVLDQFGTVSYGNNNGSANWAGNWVETNDNGAAGSGNVLITGGELRLDNLDDGSFESVRRAVDLSAAASATLSFNARTDTGVDASDSVIVEVSSNGGGSWTTLVNVTGISGAVTGPVSFDISAYATANTQIRFRINAGYTGGTEYFYVDNAQITYTVAGPGGRTAFSAATDTAAITVTAPNSPPTASDNTVTATEDVPYVFSAPDFGYSDPDGDPLDKVQITQLPTIGSLELNGVAVTLNQEISKVDIDAGLLTFTAAPDAYGAAYDSFEFSVSDGTVYGASTTTYIDATFDANADGFTYADITNPTWADGSYQPAGGSSGGGLLVDLAGGATGGPTSGGWSSTFTLTQDTDVTISLLYRMIIGSGYENTEYGELFLRVDGVAYGGDVNTSLVHQVGDGNGGIDDDSGWQNYQTTIALTTGNHTIELSAYNNASTAADEWVEGYFDDVSVTSAGDATMTIDVTPVNDIPVANPDAYTIAQDSILTVDWWDSAWTQRQEIAIDNSGRGQLDEFPILVTLTDGVNIDSSLLKADGTDLRFFDDQGGQIELAYEIESWDPAPGGTSYVWVKVPTIDAGSITDSIWMYYGNTGAGDGQNAEAVWDAGYGGVWHLHDDVLDSAGTNEGTNSGSIDATGIVGDGQSFDGVSAEIYTSTLFSDPQDFTVEAWFQTTSASGVKIVGLEDQQTGLSNGNWDRMLYVGTDGLVYFGAYDDNLSSTDVANSAATYNDGNWHHAVGVRDDATDTLLLYIDGVLVDTSANGKAETYDGYWRLGGYKTTGWPAGADGYFNGLVDEARVSTQIRSADWINAEYATVTDANFLTFSGAESAGQSGVLLNDTDVDGDPLTGTYVLASGPANGGLVFNSDGSFTYTPDPGYSGVDTFQYVANDGSVDSAATTVTINVTPTSSHSISGTIYEDVNGDAQSGDFSGRNSVTVRLFRDGGDGLANGADDTFVVSTLTAGGGAYSFTGLTDDTYWVVVDSKTIFPTQGTAAPSSVWAEQTYAVTGGMDGAASFLGASGALYGGRDPNVSDNSTNAAASLATSEHVTRVILAGANTTNIDSAFSFNVVTNLRGDGGDDDGGGTGRHSQGTLDQFILNANLINGANAMRFVPAVAPNVVTGTFSDDGNYANDGGDDWWQINVTSALPTISGANTTIDGTAYSWLDGTTLANTNAGQVGTGGTVGVDGLTLNTIDKPELELAGGNLFNASALRVTAGNVTIQDLAINGFGTGVTKEQIYINSTVTDAAGAAIITGNLIGTRADGTDAGTLEFVGLFTNGAANISNNYIAYIENNAVMMSLAWNSDPNLQSVSLINNEIAYNQFTPGFTGDMVSDVPTNAVIQGNYIHDFQGAVTLDVRQGKGIEVWYQSQNVTIDNNTIENMQVAGIGINDGSNDNTISNNIITGTAGVGGSGGAGILITSFNDTAASAPTGNTITQNSIYGNAGLGIDLDARGPAFSATYVGDGITANDAGDVDAGANDLQNFPVITLVTVGAGTVTIDGLLQTPVSGSHRIEFFAGSAAGTNGYFEGERYIGSLDVTDGGANDSDGMANGVINFSTTLAAAIAADEGITATATVDLGGGNYGSTSEFSGVGILIVDTTDDTIDGSVTSIDALIANRGADGRISLREAILATNATTNFGGPDHIYFDIPEALVAGAHTIAVDSGGLGALPTITDAVVIDGTSEPDFAGTPIVELDGSLLAVNAANSGLTIDASAAGSTIRGLVINSFGADGIILNPGADGNTIEGNYIGTNVAGNVAAANADDGIEVDSDNNIIRNNLVSGNTDVGILLHGGDGNVVVGNLIGTDASGTAAISPANQGSARNGITIRNGAANNIIGGTTAADRNIISGNQDDGVLIASTAGSGNVVSGNYIGVDISGAVALGNAGQGIEIQGGGNTIGGTAAGAGNVISANAIEGILITGASATGNLVQGNYIGVNATATLTLGNAEEGIQIFSGASGNTIGGSAAGAGNVIGGNGSLSGAGIAIEDDGTDGTVVQGNWIGTDQTGTADLGNLNSGVEVRGTTGNPAVSPLNTLIGGTNAGEGNVIAFNDLDGVRIRNDAVDVRILGNEIYSNGQQAIDLWPGTSNDGATANDAGDGDAGSNYLQNYPGIDSAVVLGGAVTISGHFNNADGSRTRPDSTYRIEFFANPAAATGPEGRTYLGSISVTTDSNGDASFTSPALAFAGYAAGDRVTATATMTSSTGGFGAEIGSTSELSASYVTSGPVAYSISGTIYEDVNGDANLADAVGSGGVTVRLFSDGGDGIADGADDTFVTSTLTSAVLGTLGQYSFTGLSDSTTYWVVVDSKTVAPDAGVSAADTAWAEQTYAVTGALTSSGTLASSGALYGGRSATSSDDSTDLVTSLPSSDHVTRIDISGGDATGIDSAFSFNVVTNTRGDGADDDGSAPRLQQGSLHQFIINANTITGANEMRFVPASDPNVVNGVLGGGDDWWQITVIRELPQITDAGTTIDGRAYDSADGVTIRDTNTALLGYVGAIGLGADGIAGTADDPAPLTGVQGPELEIVAGPHVGVDTTDSTADDVLVGLDIQSPDVIVRRISIHGFGHDNTQNATLDSEGDIRIGTATGTFAGSTFDASGIVIEENAIGFGPASLTPADDPGASNRSVNGIVIAGPDGGTIQNNVVAFSGRFGTFFTADSDGWTVEGNDYRWTAVESNGSQDSIDIGNDSGGNFIRRNYFYQSDGAGVDSWQGAGGNTIENNTFDANGQFGNELSAIRLFGAGSTVQYNLIQNSIGDGVLVVSDVQWAAAGHDGPATGNTITRNSFVNTGIAAIDLVAANGGAIGSPYSNNDVGDGATPNDGAILGTSANYGMDYPVFQSASLSGTALTVSGYIGIAPNDSDFDSAQVEIYESDASGAGVVYLGSLTADSSGNFSGTIDVTGKGLSVSDTISGTATAGIGPEVNSTSEFGLSYTVVAGVNNPPVNTVPGAQVVNEDTPLALGSISVTDPDGNLASTELSVLNGTVAVTLQGAATISAGVNGTDTLTISGSEADINATLATLVYQGNPNYNGGDTLTVLSTDSGGTPLSDSDTVSITVDPVNDAPTTADNTVTTPEDTAYVFAAADFNFSDPDGDALGSVTIDTLPLAGTLELNSIAVTAGQVIDVADINAGNLTFTPAPDANGAGYADFDFTVTETGVAASFDSSVPNGTDVGSSALTLSNVQGGTDELYVVVISMRSDQSITSIVGGGLTWTKQIEQQGGRGQVDFAMYTAYGSPGNFDLTITTDTALPVAAVVGRYSGTDGVIYGVAVSNTNGQATGSGTDLVAVTGGTDDANPVLDIDPGAADRIIINGLNSRLSVITTSDTDYAESDVNNATAGSSGDTVKAHLLDHIGPPAGVDNISHTIASDRDWVMGAIVVGKATLSSSAATMTIDVDPTPDLVDDAYTVDEDSGLTNLTVLGNDDTGSGLGTITGVSVGSLGGTIAIAAGSTSIDYTPAAGVSGTETFTYTFTDSNGDADTATVTVTVNQLNDPASFGGNTSGLGNEDAGAITGTLTASDAADGMTTPNFMVSVAASNGVASIDPVSGAWSYTPNADFNGLDLFTASVTDDDGNVETQAISLTVNAVVDIVDDADSTNEDTAVTSSVLTNDSFENAGRTITAVTQGANGTVAIVNPNLGTVSYTPNADFNGVDSYTYTVSSGGVTETATVTVTINAVNDAPVTGPDVVTTITGQPVIFDVRTNDIDPDGDTLFVSEINGIPIAAGSPVTVAEGTFSLNSLTLTFTPAPGYVGNPSFTYTVSDGNGGSALGAINLTVSSALGGGSGGSSIAALDAGLSPDFQVQPEQRSESSAFGGYTTETEVTPTEFVLPAVRESLKERGAMVQRMSGATSVADVAEIRSDSLFAGLLVDPALYVLPAVEAVQLELTEAQGRGQPLSARLAPGAQTQLNDRGDRASATPALQFPNVAAPAAGEGDAVESAGAPQPAAAKSTTGGDAAADDAAPSTAGERGAGAPADAARPAGRVIIGDALADDARASAAAQPPRPLGTASFAAQLREESAKLRADPFAGRIR